MLLALGMLFGFAVFFWLVFFKFKWLKFSVPWVLVSAFFVVHVLLIFLIGLRFMTPASNNAKVVQHTIQLVPRLTEPTLVTAVLVEQNQPVKKGQPLFQFDRRPYEYKVQQLEAQLAQAKQNVQILKADIDVATQKLAKTQSETVYARYQQNLATSLAAQGAGPEEEAQRWDAQFKVNEAAVQETAAELERAKLALRVGDQRREHQRGRSGGRTGAGAVLPRQHDARRARGRPHHQPPGAARHGGGGLPHRRHRLLHLRRWPLPAGRLLSGDSQIHDQRPAGGSRARPVSRPDLPGKVQSIWKASGEGQYLPSGSLPVFHPDPPKIPQGCFAVAILFDDPDQSKFPIGAQGVAAVYTRA